MKKKLAAPISIGERLVTLGEHVVELCKVPVDPVEVDGRRGVNRWWWHCSCGKHARNWWYLPDVAVRRSSARRLSARGTC